MVFLWQPKVHVFNIVQHSFYSIFLLLFTRIFLVNISNESSQHIGVKIKKSKPSTESNDLQVTDFTKIKKRKLEFEPRLLNLTITKISTIINKTGLNEIVHIEGVVFDLKEEKVKFKLNLEFRNAKLKMILPS